LPVVVVERAGTFTLGRPVAVEQHLVVELVPETQLQILEVVLVLVVQPQALAVDLAS
jgi:hypothetical protein